MEELAFEVPTAIEQWLPVYEGFSGMVLEDGVFYATDLLHVELDSLDA